MPGAIDVRAHSGRIQHSSANSAPSSPVVLVNPTRSSALALLSLSQDITALVSLSVEATASLINDSLRSALGAIGFGEVIRPDPSRRRGSDTGTGLAVVVVGAAEPTGQSLTLRLAKSGYTVFPFVPMPLASTATASSPLGSLLLAWSSVQKRLRARDPGHAGAVVPVITDDVGDASTSSSKRTGRFVHAGETVRAYCRENGLLLVAIVCAAPSASIPLIAESTSPHIEPTPLDVASLPIAPRSLARTDEETLLSLYRAHVLDPLSVVRELGDMLSSPRGAGTPRGRVLFIETTGCVDDAGNPGMLCGARRMVAAARTETARVIRVELGPAGIDVCEVVVGPMLPRVPSPYPIRPASNGTEVKTISDRGSSDTNGEDTLLASRLRLLARIFAVDDALVYSCVRRAIEDRYPRARHHAGLVPLIASVANATPGSGIVRLLGRWMLGRLFAKRR